MRRRRVKITGLGPVTPAGVGREAFWKGILEPVSRIRAYTKLGEEWGPFIAAYLDSFSLGDFVDDLSGVPRGAARQTQLAIAAMQLALQDAGLSPEDIRSRICGVAMGSALMDFGSITTSIDSVHKKGLRGIIPRCIITSGQASVADTMNQVIDSAGPTYSIQNSCCSGMDAIGLSADKVATGEWDLAICGGTEAPLFRHPLLEMRAIELTPMTNEMPERFVRPFDLWRTTGVVSEGACVVVLESEESPRPAYGFVEGYGFHNDIRLDLCDGLTEAGRLALADAGLRPGAVEAISAWGPGHKQIDAAESRAMANLFGEHLAEIPVVSIKGAIGSPLGAAPSIQVAAAALALRHGVIPPTVNWERPDPECRLNLSRQPREIRHEISLVNAHGIGRVNSSLVLRRC